MNTKLGLHVGQGSRNGYGLVLGQIPAVICAVGEGGALQEATDKSNGRTITIYRDQTVFHDAPLNLPQSTVAEMQQKADELWAPLKAVYAKNPADYYQVTNEVGGNDPTSIENLIAFETRLMELAEIDGLKLAIGNQAGGSPHWDLWVQFFVPHIKRAEQGGHIYSRHAYGGVENPSESGLLTIEGPQPADGNAARPFEEARYLREQGIVTPMVITEAGQYGGYRLPKSLDTLIEDWARYDELCRQHDNIWGFCVWTYGNYQNLPVNIEVASGHLADYLARQGGATRPQYPHQQFRFTSLPTSKPYQVSQKYNANPQYYGNFCYPSGCLTGHEGIDIAVAYGSPIHAVADGVVVRIRQATSGHNYGNAVYLQHSNGYRTTYAHLKNIFVRVGDQVISGQIIGAAGNTGNVFPRPSRDNPFAGTHLHLTLYKENATVNGETDQPFDIIDPTPFLQPLFGSSESPPPPPRQAGWGWARSLRVMGGDTARVTNAGGINLREKPSVRETKLGLIPYGTTVYLKSDEVTNGYYPIEVAIHHLKNVPQVEKRELAGIPV